MSIEATLIAPDQLAALQATEPVVVIDTRDADTFAAGHIPGAVNLREVFTFLATSTPEGLKELKATFADALGKAGLQPVKTGITLRTGRSGFSARARSCPHPPSTSCPADWRSLVRMPRRCRWRAVERASAVMGIDEDLLRPPALDANDLVGQ